MSLNIESRNYLYTLLKSHLENPSEESLYEAYQWGKKLYLSQVSPDILIWLFLETKEIIRKELPAVMLNAEAEFDKILLEIMAAYNLQFYKNLQMQKELEQTVTRLTELDQMKSQFISTAAHELRTPLTAIKGFFELCIDEEGLTDEHHRYLDIIMRNINRLELITHDLLDQQRLLSGKLTLEIKTLELDDMLSKIIEELQPIFAEKNQRTQIYSENTHKYIEGDESRTIQVITNILTNASKFSPDNSEINIEVYRDNGNYCVAITDKGIGISNEDQKKMFTPFPQIEKDGNYSGVGLGLSISKGIMKLQGGSISCYSEGKGKGTTFTVYIPHKPDN